MFTINDLRGGYVDLVHAVADCGELVSPRGMKTREVRGFTFRLTNPHDTLPTGVGRGLIPNIGAAEAIQLIGGFSDPAGMVRLSPRFEQFQTVGILHGAYGPRARRQLPEAVEKLATDQDSRQALVMIYDPWRDQDDVKDTPCTIGLQFFIRPDADGEDRLECHCMMRSNDVWLGLPYDVFQFTQLQLTVARLLSLRAGDYVHHASSLHLYERDFTKVDKLAQPAEGTPAPFVPDGVPGAGWTSVRENCLRSWRGQAWEAQRGNESGSKWYREQLRKVWEGQEAYAGERL